MTKPDGRGRPPTQADVGKRLTLRDDQGTVYYGILRGLTRDGEAIVRCYRTDYGGGWMMHRPEHVMVTGAEVLDDA